MQTPSDAEKQCVEVMSRLLNGNLLLVPAFGRSAFLYMTEGIDPDHPTQETMSIVLLRGAKLLHVLEHMESRSSNAFQPTALLVLGVGLALYFRPFGVILFLCIAQTTSAYARLSRRAKLCAKAGVCIVGVVLIAHDGPYAAS